MSGHAHIVVVRYALILGRPGPATGHKDGINAPIFHSENNNFCPECRGHRSWRLNVRDVTRA